VVSYNKFQDFSEQLAEGIHDFDAHTFKLYLTNATPSASADAVKADLAEISAGNGYTAGGATVTIATSETSGTTTVTGTEVTWTASGGTIGPFQYAVLYNDTSASDNLIAYWDYGSALTLQDGEDLTATFGGSSPGNIFTLA
jgi:hypothetical protein